MRVDEIGDKVVARYNFSNRQALLDDLLSSLRGYSEEELDRIWIKFDRTYLGLAPPKPAHFHSIAYDLGIAGKPKVESYEGAWICECGQHYGPLTAYLCPVCHSTKVKAVGDAAHLNYKHVNEDSQWYRDKLSQIASERLNTAKRPRCPA